MYHIRSLIQSFKRSDARAAGRTPWGALSANLLGTAALITAAMIPAQAIAATTKSARQTISQTKLSAMNGADVNKIDWRQPEMKLRFDLTESDWMDGMDMILSMSPMGSVGKREPVLVSLNNGPPIRLDPRGQSFDARLKFDPAFIRAKGNVITIRTPAPNGAACLTSAHGSWDVNLSKSSIVVRSRAKSRNLYLREFAARLANPATTPKTVAIVARGSDKARFEMLAAQGIALQTPSLPTFRTRAGSSDVEVIIARRDELSPFVSDREILSATGSKISLHKGRPMRLVITGDTDLQVTEAAKSFAAHSLPPVRRRHSSTGEVNFQRGFDDQHIELSKRTRFSELDKGYFAMDWRATPNILTFNVADPSTQSGEILLRLSSSKKIAKDSKVKLELNGKSLGFAALDRRRKTVAFTIPQGSLRGHENELKITPLLNKAATVDSFGQACPGLDDTPGFFIGNGSRIDLKSSGNSPVTELSRLTANGGTFAEAGGINTHIILPARGSKDYAASLKVLAQLAKASGTGWTDASVSRSSADISGKNLLVIGPRAGAADLLGRGPRALSAALNGKSSHGQLIANAATYEKFASADAASTLALYAKKTRPASRIGSGGVAALFPDNNRLIGVISNTPGRSFSSVTQDLLSPKQWNKLRGSVSRWNSKSVLMTQTPINVPLSALPSVNAPKAKGLSIASLNMARLTEGLNDGLTEIAVGWGVLTDNAIASAEDFGASLEAKLAGITNPAPKAPNLYPRPPKLTSEYTENMKQQRAEGRAPLYAELKPPVYVRPSLKTAPLKTELRGLSQPESLYLSGPQKTSWLSGVLAKLKFKSEPRATQRASSPQLSTGQKFNSPDIGVNTGVQPKIKNDGFFNSLKKSSAEKLASVNQVTAGYIIVLFGLLLILSSLLLGLLRPSKGTKPVPHTPLFGTRDP